MLDLRKRDTICARWTVNEPNFDGKVLIPRLVEGIVVDSWTCGLDYFLLAMTLDGKLHKLEASQVVILHK